MLSTFMGGTVVHAALLLAVVAAAAPSARAKTAVRGTDGKEAATEPRAERGPPEEEMLSPPSASPAEEDERFEVDTDAALNIRKTDTPEASSAVLTVLETKEILSTTLTLNDYLRYVPGYEPLQAFWYRWPAARGLVGSVNFMVDGVILTSPLDYRFEASEGLFLEEFKSVELTTGPAGVLWGSFSLLGTINMVSGQDATPGTELSVGAGAPGLIHTTARYETKLGEGHLRLFAGYRQIDHFDRTPSKTWLSVPPYGDEYLQVDATGEFARVGAPADRFAVASIQYRRRGLSAYLRIPFQEVHFNTTEYGAALPTDQAGERRAVDAMGYVSYQKGLLGGKLATVARASWYLLREVFDRALVARNPELPEGARVLSEATISRVVGLVEASYRIQRDFLRTDILGGANLTLEFPHKTNVATPEPSLGGESVIRGRSLEQGVIATVSPYIFAESRLWKRLNLAAGVRYNNAGNTYRALTLYQGNVGLRFAGKNYAKFGITEGMRPPQLPDRAGIIPVQRALLEPERSRALTLEFNSTLEDIGPFVRTFARITLARTETVENILRETFLVEPLRQRPVNAAGFVIDSLEASLDMKTRLSNAGLKLSYRVNEVRDIRARSNDSTEQAATVLQNPACGTSICANSGPRHRFAALTTVDVKEWAQLQASVGMQCGGKRLVVEANPDGSRPARQRVEDATTLGCYGNFSAGATFPANPRQFSVSLRAENLASVLPPPSQFGQAEFNRAEGGQRTERRTRIYALINWRFTSQPW